MGSEADFRGDVSRAGANAPRIEGAILGPLLTFPEVRLGGPPRGPKIPPETFQEHPKRLPETPKCLQEHFEGAH